MCDDVVDGDVNMYMHLGVSPLRPKPVSDSDAGPGADARMPASGATTS